MIISAGQNIEGYKISEYKEIVFGFANSSEGAGYRQVALKKMTENASKLGANAIISFKMEIYPVSGSVQEATAYGNAVIADSIDGITRVESQTQPKINLEAYTRKPKTDDSPIGQIHDINGYKFVVCPKCNTKYKVETDEQGHVHIKGFDDVDDDEPGLQVFCLRCGTKFTVPER